MVLKFFLIFIIYFLDFLISLIGVLLRVAFFTLIERKVIGVGHYRKGPNKVSFIGVLQPLRDAAKLLTKENLKLNSFKIIFYSLGPSLSLIIIILIWGWYSFSISLNPTFMQIFLIVTLISLSVYGFVLICWGSNSKYSLLGGNRVIAQILSYEVCLMIFVIIVAFFIKRFRVILLSLMQETFWLLWISLPVFFLWLTLCFAESNRTPFDTAEGESEIVSGFNIEYGSGTFAFIFIREYGIIMMIRFLTSLLFLGSFFLWKIFFICVVFVWVRCSFPRLRYDKLIFISWKIFLPQGIVACLLCVSLY